MHREFWYGLVGTLLILSFVVYLFWPARRIWDKDDTGEGPARFLTMIAMCMLCIYGMNLLSKI